MRACATSRNGSPTTVRRRRANTTRCGIVTATRAAGLTRRSAPLENPTYRGVRVWGRQQKYEVLVDPDDVTAGHETRTRWRDQAEWITPARRTHEALVTDDLADAVRLRMQARRGPDLVCSRGSSTPYALRGMLYCGACGRWMQGAARVGKRATRILNRCEVGKSRSVPAELADHPPTVYLREDAVTPRLDEWIASLADPEDLPREQDSDLAATARPALQRQRVCHVN